MTIEDCAAPAHGTRYAYQQGCTHPQALIANREYYRAWVRTPSGRAHRDRYDATRRAVRASNAASQHSAAARLRQRIAQARDLHEHGWSTAGIAARFGCSVRTIERYIKGGS